MWIAFFFLLRPGEYLQPSSTSHPFQLQDIQLWRNSEHIDIFQCDPGHLLSVTFVSLTFNTQKNGRRGEPIGHGRLGHPVACPVLAVARRVQYLRSLSATPATPLCSIGPIFIPIVPSQITTLLRAALSSTTTPLGVLPTDINAKSLCSTGAMALLNSNINPNRIRLIGCWQSDAMLCYLHVQAHDIMSDYSSIMLQGGDFTLIPTSPSTLPPFK
jgi:hypothetical protein